MKKKILTLALALAMIITVLPFSAVDAFAYKVGTTYDGADITKDKYAASTIDYLILKYYHRGRFLNMTQCFGYAEKVKAELSGGKVKTKYYKGLKYSKANLKKVALNVRAGTHIRFSHGKTFNGWSGHSVIILKLTSKEAYWTDNNYYDYGTVAYHKGTFNDFYNYYKNNSGYKYINMVSNPKSYARSSKPSLAVRYSSGANRIAWTKTTKTTRYDIYRSYSKKGKYVKIGTTTSVMHYADKKAKKKKTAYYKIRSVKKGADKWSNVASAVRK